MLRMTRVANVSKHKAMRYARILNQEKTLHDEVSRWFDQADAEDLLEDRENRKDQPGDELPKWVANKEKRVEKISEESIRTGR
jgi:hypothetical protein